MIVVSIHPNKIAVDLPTDITLSFTNTGPGTCTNVRFTFRVPRQILLIRGRRQVQVPRLREGECHDHPLQVQAREQGSFQLVSTNFSYRDFAGRGQRIPETNLPLRVIALAAPSPSLVPVLELELETTCLPVGSWCPLSGRISNVGEAAARGITLSASGPALQSQKEMLGDLPTGGILYFTLSVHAAEIGTRVPVHMEVTFQDDSGKLRHCSWRAHLAIEEIQPSISKSGMRADNVFNSYKEGLKRLLTQLEKDHPRYSEALVLQSRLLENIAQAWEYGDNEVRCAARAQILDALNHLTLDVFGYSFNELCGLGD